MVNSSGLLIPSTANASTVGLGNNVMRLKSTSSTALGFKLR